MEKIDKNTAQKKTKKNSNSFINTKPQLTGVNEQRPAVASKLSRKILKLAEKQKVPTHTEKYDMIAEDMPFLVDIALTEKLSDKMDKLLRLGLGNPSKIRQYQQALDDPSSAMKYSAMREHIAEVLTKLIAVIENDNAIYQRIYDALNKRLRTPVKQSNITNTLKKKSIKESVEFETLAEVYVRGLNSWDPAHRLSSSQFAFNRVNSFVNGGRAASIDNDLTEMKNPCWKGYDMVGTKKKKGKEVPNCVPEETNPYINTKPTLDKKTVKREVNNVQLKSKDPMSEGSTKPTDRLIGTDSLTKTYVNDTPNQRKTLSVIKRTLKK